MQTLEQLRRGDLAGTISLKLSEELNEFPLEILDLADTLEVLDLSGNKLNALPQGFNKLQKLKIFFCSDNLFEVLPAVLGECRELEMVGFKSNQITTVPAKALGTQLRWLILTNNQITEIPATIGNCHRMQKLMLAGNRLTQLPEQLQNCRNLGLLRISANLLEALPLWLLQMPKLAWLAYSGNPFHRLPEIKGLETINWDNLELTNILGEGASGVISKAVLNKQANQTVAVKVFKGAMTSDGLPEDEMSISIAAGQHEGLIKLLGEIYNHPLKRRGLVMELIPPSYGNLAGPPSLQSCTRDVFKPGTQLPVYHIIKIAHTIASVAAHLHQRGIMHSDLYAHNILTDNQGNTLFSDFGAACCYDTGDVAVANALQRLEVRAFGYLLDDLISVSVDDEQPQISQLCKLRDLCLQHEVLSRPSFNALEHELKQLLNYF